MVAEHPVRPAGGGQRPHVLGDPLLDRFRFPWCAEQSEVGRELGATSVPAAVVGRDLLGGAVRLDDQQARLIVAACVAIANAPHLAEDVERLRIIGRVDREQAVVLAMPRAPTGIGWVVAEARVLDQVLEGVEAEAVGAAVEPEAHRLEHRALEGGVSPVEIGLRGEELVEVVLMGGRVERPAAAAEDRQPVVRRAAVRRGVAPDVPVAARAGAR